jgi:hypothetical protein
MYLESPSICDRRPNGSSFPKPYALEQFHYSSNTYICNYVLLLDYLITTTANDVCLLVEKNVIINRRSGSAAVTTPINTLGHMIVEPYSCYNDL